MPYDKNADLPDGVKKLPAEAQTVYRKAFNSAYDGDDASAAKIAWAAVKKAGFSKDKDGNWSKSNKQMEMFAETHEFDAEIFSTGTWNGDKYSEQDLEDIIVNFNALADTVKPPVKLGHAWKEGQPALGWVKSLKRAGNKLIATLSDVPQIVYEAIKAGRYKRVSSEIYWNYKSTAGKTFNYVLKAVALLGSDIPAVSDLKDLTAYLTQTFPQTGTADRVVAYESELDKDFNIITVQKEPDKKTAKKELDKMADDNVKKYEEVIEKQKAALEKAEAAAKDAEAKLKKFAEESAKKETERRTKEFTDKCESMVKAGKLTPAERDKLVEGVQTFNFTENDGFEIPFATFCEVVEARQVLDLDEHGKDKKAKEYASASEELADRAKKYSVDHKVEYQSAVRAILEQDTDLADRYKME